MLTGVPAPYPLPSADLLTPKPEEQAGVMRQLIAQVPDWAGLDWGALVEALLRLGRTDIPSARLVEGHVDAVRIHREAGSSAVPGALYGVWASRSRETGLRGSRVQGRWVLDGTLRFASGAGLIDRALVPAWDDAGKHHLLDLDVSGWDFDPTVWRTSAMALSRSFTATVAKAQVEAAVVGPASFYLGRAGFFPGGVGVAAVWAGGAARVADLLEASLPPARRRPAQQLRVGRVRAEVSTATAVCRQAARDLALLVPTGEREELRTAATLARAGVAAAVRRLLGEARTAGGAAGWALDEELTRAVDDLGLYTAQQSEDGDAQWLGQD